MARFTRNDLEKVVDNINSALTRGESDYRLSIQGRNGYIGVDLFKNGIEMHMIGSGDNPREAAAVAMGWVVSNAVAIKTA